MVAADLAGELPARQRELSIARGAGVKLVVPQRILLPSNGSGLGNLQVRLDGALSGKLEIEVDNARVWQREISAAPERRLLVPLSGIPLLAGAKSIRIAVRPAPSGAAGA
jgi:hypothetical protein